MTMAFKSWAFFTYIWIFMVSNALVALLGLFGAAILKSGQTRFQSSLIVPSTKSPI
jgi:hypothetical protein